MQPESVGFVGTVGGVGTTWSVLELGGVLAREGQAVLVLDLDFATQGLGRHVDGTVPVDATELLADPSTELADAVHEWPVDGDGRFEVVPALAPFVQIAAAKSEAAGERVAERIEAATERADWVLLDVPPVVSNQAIGAVTAADRVVAVMPPSERGVDALQRERGRLADVGTAFDSVLAVGDGEPPADATTSLPARPDGAPAHRPATLESSGHFVRAARTAAATLFDLDVDTSSADSPIGRLGTLGEKLRN
ncbi:AAA family ATPase [Halodesulfurarchaeum sp. HSR-GB]|uniref:ParA family protein n=1 Tax=Halodesulfurarchaeum sp. HSR-GB TaxID=3074077 RepID=UPI0028618B8B|nr:AAA family ATPase [Halodesulfurarchaeum sp. HSR-GB]MDR5656060.1 AAA family ATPase [Halodesulfurarchaeum sp. HSR-GB]